MLDYTMPSEEQREAFWKCTENVSSLKKNWKNKTKQNTVAATPLLRISIYQEHCDGS